MNHLNAKIYHKEGHLHIEIPMTPLESWKLNSIFMGVPQKNQAKEIINTVVRDIVEDYVEEIAKMQK